MSFRPSEAALPALPLRTGGDKLTNCVINRSSVGYFRHQFFKV
ncbi:hypothetical protein Mal52_31310 [Symmachiella dynata]|uniref:Uncharacterized protein n=1 Tax=Symmachiella dynata TaxID=2527995 RepID=A0A517ZQ81_9PLAN|nr:hypothetical protein Mal52_31310 [Symmachiella dynata]